MINILDAVHDDNVFKKAVPLETFGAWLVYLKALFALPMSAEEHYRANTGLIVGTSG